MTTHAPYRIRRSPLPGLLLACLLVMLGGCDEDEVAVEPVDAGPSFDFGPTPDFGDIGGGTGTDGSTGIDDEDVAVDGGEELPDTEDLDGELPEPDVCVPQCVNKQCGDDGCGGTCGTCPVGSVCTAAAECETNGDLCEAPILVGEFPTKLTVDLAGFQDDFDCADGAGTADLVLDLRPGEGVPVYTSVTGPGQLELSTSDSCGLGSVCGASGASALTAMGTDGSVFMVVEQLDASAAGEVTIEVRTCSSFCDQQTCGISPCGLECACGAGKSCVAGQCEDTPAGDACTGSPIPVSGLPLVETGQLTGLSDAESCADAPAGLPDIVWVYSPPFDQGASLTLSADPGVVAWLGVGSCSTCTTPIASGENVGIQLAAGQEYYLVVEGPENASYSVQFNPCDGGCSALCPCALGSDCQQGQCVAPTTADTCESIQPLTDSLDWSTTSLTDAITCAASAPGAVEAVFEFTAPADGTYNVWAVASRPLRIHRLNSCADGTPACLASASNPSALQFDATADEVVVVAVEDSQAGLDGGFTVSVENCTALCAGAPCDTPACGSICGCAEGQTCNQGTCMAAAPLDTCDTAVTLNTAPLVITAEFSGLSDALVCANGVGAGTPDAVYRFEAPTTGVYAAAVLGTSNPVLFEPKFCGDAVGCSGAVSGSMLFQLSQGETQWLAVDGPEGSAYELSISRVLGVSGGLGSACTSAVDCPLADRCVAGVCTVDCAPGSNDLACVGAADGPRGDQFACEPSLCVLTDTSCVHTCLPLVGESPVCAGPGDCAAGACAGFAQTADAVQATPFCAASSIQLEPTGGACDQNASCATNLCAGGQCAAPCLNTGACGTGGLCEVYLPLWSQGSAVGICSNTINALSDTTCTADLDCDVGFCDGHLGPNGLERYCSIPVGSGVLGDACTTDTDCEYATCLFNDDVGFEPAYCSRVCNSDVDCTEGMSCRPVTLYDAGTETTDDDLAINRCVKGALNQSCSLLGADICDEGLTCQNIGLNQGVCQ